MTSTKQGVSSSVTMQPLPASQEAQAPRSDCFICGSPEAQDSVTSANDDDFTCCICRLFNFDVSTQGSQLFVGHAYCLKCQEYLRTIGTIHKELDELQAKLQAARQTIYEQLKHNFKRSSCQLHHEARPTDACRREQRIQAQKRILKRASLMNSRSRMNPRIPPWGSNFPDHSETVLVKVEPRSDLYLTDSDHDEFVENACYRDSLQDIELRQPAVRLERMVILESLIKQAPVERTPSMGRITGGNKKNRSDANKMKLYAASSPESSGDPSYSNTLTGYRMRKRNRPDRYSEYFPQSDEELDIFGNSGSLSEASFGEDDDFIIGLDNELYQEYDSDSDGQKLGKKSTGPKPKANQVAYKKVSRDITITSTGAEPRPPATRDDDDIREICVVPTLHQCHISNCGKEYISPGGLRKHLLTVHSISSKKRDRAPAAPHRIITAKDTSGNVQYVKLFPCETCGKEFKDSSELKYHQERHKPDSEQKYICEQCGKGFYKSSLLKRHKVTHLPKDAPGSSSVGDGAQTRAEVYGRVLCQLCGVSTSNLTQHMRTHTGEKLHKCDFCEKAFNTANSAKAHMRIHTGEKPFECKTCGFKFRAQQSYLRHQKVHDPVKAYICDFCGKSFRFKRNLTEHLHVHTRELPYRCNLCGRRYAERELLGKHMNDDHTAEQIERKRRAQSQRARVPRADNISDDRSSQDLRSNGSSEKSEHPANQSLLIPFQHSSVIPTRYY